MCSQQSIAPCKCNPPCPTGRKCPKSCILPNSNYFCFSLVSKTLTFTSCFFIDCNYILIIYNSWLWSTPSYLFLLPRKYLLIQYPGGKKFTEYLKLKQHNTHPSYPSLGIPRVKKQLQKSQEYKHRNCTVHSPKSSALQRPPKKGKIIQSWLSKISSESSRCSCDLKHENLFPAFKITSFPCQVFLLQVNTSATGNALTANNIILNLVNKQSPQRKPFLRFFLLCHSWWTRAPEGTSCSSKWKPISQ